MRSMDEEVGGPPAQGRHARGDCGSSGASPCDGRPAAARSTAEGLLVARRIVLRGRVQGVGFRPFVHRLATRSGLRGWVRNVGGQVIVYAEGPETALGAFEDALLREAPPFARPELATSASAEVLGYEAFFVEESAPEAHDPAGNDGSERPARPTISVPPDVALCDDCRRELADPSDRRYRYPFINCTQCGPRFTIIAALPYDRERTSMAGFPLCPECAHEYGDVADRRYHAEPVACPRCGPRVEFCGAATEVGGNSAAIPAGSRADEEDRHATLARVMGEEAFVRAVAVLREGGILGVKGLGGYHLLCDATSSSAVQRLRARKKRPGKPFAVMVPRVGPDGLDLTRTLVALSPAGETALTSPTHPIVLAPRATPLAAAIAPDIAPEVAPGLCELGVFLPYTPLHEILLADFGRPVVATSGNESGEPLTFTRGDAERYLGPLVDGFLHHDRPILRPVDDSVLRDFGDVTVPLRLGRGFAPLELGLGIGRGLAPLELPLRRYASRPRLAVGGHLKSAVALAWGDRVVLSAHLGELDRPRAVDAFSSATESLQALYAVEAEEILCDLHPDYASTRWARAQDLPVLAIPHHRAHASALAGEHPDIARWLVFAWDGVGLGEDGTLWGGEVFHGAPGRWHRVGSVRPFRLLGAGRAGREPLRSARALAWELGLDLRHGLERSAWERGLGTMTTTAVGRIFDAAAALLLGRADYDYEAQGPIEIEAAANGSSLQAASVGTPFDVSLRLPVGQDGDAIWRIDWEPLVRLLLDAPSGRAARRDSWIHECAALVHALLAQAAVDLALQVARAWPFDAIGLAGGVFQNRRLTEELRTRAARAGLDVRIGRQVPMNDGGLAYGQVIEAIAREENRG